MSKEGKSFQTVVRIHPRHITSHRTGTKPVRRVVPVPYSQARGIKPATASAATPGTEISAAALVGVTLAALPEPVESKLLVVVAAVDPESVAVAEKLIVVAAAAL